MGQTISLTTTARDTSKKAKDLRREDIVPCVLYGNDVENTPLQCTYSDIRIAYRAAGKSTIVELDVAGKKVPVLFHDLDFDGSTEKITHVDFYSVDMKKEIEATVPLVYTGDSPAVKDLGGALHKGRDHVTVTCLPLNLPHELTVDISSLETFEDQLHVSDINLPEGVTVVEEADLMIATVQEPRKAEVFTSESEDESEESADGEGGGEEEKKEEGAEADS